MSFFRKMGQVLAFAGLLAHACLAFAADGSASSSQDIFGAAQKNIDPNESASNKVKLSGRQMMLSESIIKSLCFVHLGVEVDKNLIKVAEASSLFSETLDALRSGSVQKSVLRETETQILDYLELLAASWTPFKNAVNSILTTREPTKADLEKLLHLGEEILLFSTMTSREIEAHYGDSSLGEALAKTIGIAGHQRTLIEKATKQFCLIVANVEPEQNATLLLSTREMFFDTIFDLFFGNETSGVVAPTNIEMEFLYEEQLAAWFSLEDLFDRTASKDTFDVRSLELSLFLTENLVEQSENALTNY